VTIVESGDPVTTVELPRPAEVGWLGPDLLVVDHRARIITSRAEVIEHRLDGPMRLLACVDGVALLAGDGGAALVTRAGIKPVRARPTVAGAAPNRFLAVVGDAIAEWDTAGVPKRTWRVPDAGAIHALGGTASAVWRVTHAAPQRIDVIPLITRGQPRSHELPAPIAQIAAHPATDWLACLEADTGRVHLVDLGGDHAIRTLETAPVERPEAIALTRAGDWHVVACAAGAPAILVPLTRRAEPMWREQLVKWTRSGIVDIVPVVPAIEQLARALALPDPLVPALVLCYGAHLCRAPGVPPDELDELLARRWPDEVAGTGRLARSGALVYREGWIALAPEHCRTLDDVD
jgi:hypothetical protein